MIWKLFFLVQVYPKSRVRATQTSHIGWGVSFELFWMGSFLWQGQNLCWLSLSFIPDWRVMRVKDEKNLPTTKEKSFKKYWFTQSEHTWSYYRKLGHCAKKINGILIFYSLHCLGGLLNYSCLISKMNQHHYANYSLRLCRWYRILCCCFCLEDDIRAALFWSEYCRPRQGQLNNPGQKWGREGLIPLFQTAIVRPHQWHNFRKLGVKWKM